MLWHPKTLQNLAMYKVFFIFGRFSIAGKLPKWPKIPFQYPLALRHPKILEKCRKHHRILVSVRNRFWGLVSVRNRFWAPPPAKADIATAILTNVIEHLVLLLPPNKHAFTAKAVWADFWEVLKEILIAMFYAFPPSKRLQFTEDSCFAKCKQPTHHNVNARKHSETTCHRNSMEQQWNMLESQTLW